MLTVHHSNRLERLADALAAELRRDPLPPLQPEIIVVQSLGARRWLSFALAERLGVAMNIEFPFPAALVERVFLALAPGAPVSPVFRRDVLPWRIHALLPELWDADTFTELRRYSENDPARRWELAGQIATVFDRYLAYRPALLRGWDAGEDDREHPWQSQLWRALAEGRPHSAALADQVARAPIERNAALPKRISFFGLSTLPPFYLELLGELGRRTKAHLFALAPTQEYWGDLRGEKELRRYRRWREKRGQSPDAESPETAHPLLASLGKIGREFHEALLDLTAAREATSFEEPNGSALLHELQRGILRLEASGIATPPVVDARDRSIQVHNCHSPLRELEVLHDQLLALFEQDRTLEPRDVLVSAPDVTAYAPFIDAVFGAPESDAVKFPYSIADRDQRAQNRVADAFLRVLELSGSRYPASAVLSLVECLPVSEKFGLTAGDLPLIRRWVAESGACWGLDGDHRERLGFPKWEENSWRFALDRLLLGFALPNTGRDIFAGILPGAEIEGSSAEVLGRFVEFCETLFRTLEAFAAQARTAEEWAEVLRRALDDLCASDGDFAEAWRRAMLAIETMAENARLAGHRPAFPFAVAREHITATLASTDFGTDFLRGGITFCSLKPLRAVPHRVVALLGLKDGAFPRATRGPSFDLTLARPRPGDRTPRDDDRYLFLESILSARDVLYLSYCGQSAKDDSESPPSVIVSELLDFLGGLRRAPENATLREGLVTRHALQPFAPCYFSAKGDRFFSYSREAAQAARIACGARANVSPFINAAPRNIPERGAVSIDALSGFFAHPAKYFGRELLGMRLPFEELAPDDVEPFELDGLEKYALRQQLAESALAGEEPEALASLIRASGVLPYGCRGEMIVGATASEARALSEAVAEYAPGPSQPAAFARAQIGEWLLSGQLAQLRGERFAGIRPAKISARELVRAWCHHLFAGAAQPKHQRETILFGTDRVARFRAVKEPAAELEALLALFEQGHARPLPFFPAASHEYASLLFRPKPKSRDDAALTARKKWAGGNDDVSREAEDDWNKLIWRESPEPLGREWQEIAERVFAPLLAHLEADLQTK